jgi:hypothetical protein
MIAAKTSARRNSNVPSGKQDVDAHPTWGIPTTLPAAEEQDN